METIDTNKLNQNNLSLIIDVISKRLYLLFKIERLLWFGMIVYYTIFGFLGLHLIRHHFGLFLIRLLFPWIIVFLHFNVLVEGNVHLIFLGMEVALGFIWILFWITELFFLSKGKYKIWEADKWEYDNSYSYLFSAKTSWLLTSSVILLYQYIYINYASIPFSEDIINGILHLYSYLPIY